MSYTEHPLILEQVKSATTSWAVHTLTRGLAFAHIVVIIGLMYQGIKAPSLYFTLPLIALIDAMVRIVNYRRWKKAHHTGAAILREIGPQTTISIKECVQSDTFKDKRCDEQSSYNSFQKRWLMKDGYDLATHGMIDDFWSINWLKIRQITEGAEARKARLTSIHNKLEHRKNK